jgi:GABA(A) receptor-associated protein
MNTIPNKRKFIDTYTFSERSTEATRILQKYNDRVPIICERNSKDITAPYIDKNKYLVPHDLTVGQFIYVIKKRLRMSPTEALFIFINGNVVSNHSTMSFIYPKLKDMDGFLYITYAKEATFGFSFH